MLNLFSVPVLLFTLIALILVLLIIESKKGKAKVPLHIPALFSVALILAGYAALGGVNPAAPTEQAVETTDISTESADYTFSTDGGTTVSFMPDNTVVILSRDGAARITKNNLRSIHRALEEFEAGNLTDADPTGSDE